MIICKNCGAEYDDEQDRCPYCGGDNFGKSVQVHEDMMNELKREKRQWEKMPEKVAGKGMSWTAKLGIAAVIMVAVICIIVFIVSSISHKVSYRVEQKNLEKLESLYQSGDYEGICEYLKTVEYTYQSYFDKYTEIAGMQRYLNYLNDEDDFYLQWIVENDKADALSNISYIVSILNECQEAADAYYKYEEEDAVAYYKEYCYDYMKEHYEISEDEIIKNLIIFKIYIHTFSPYQFIISAISIIAFTYSQCNSIIKPKLRETTPLHFSTQTLRGAATGSSLRML